MGSVIISKKQVRVDHYQRQKQDQKAIDKAYIEHKLKALGEKWRPVPDTTLEVSDFKRIRCAKTKRVMPVVSGGGVNILRSGKCTHMKPTEVEQVWWKVWRRA